MGDFLNKAAESVVYGSCGELTALVVYEQTEGGIIKAVVYVCVSRTPAAWVQSGGGLICHKSAGINYQQLLTDHTPNNMDNHCS